MLSLAHRRFFASLSSAKNPLALLQEHAQKWNLCDDDGRRKNRAHWTVSLAASTGPNEVSVALVIVSFVTL